MGLQYDRYTCSCAQTLSWKRGHSLLENKGKEHWLIMLTRSARAETKYYSQFFKNRHMYLQTFGNHFWSPSLEMVHQEEHHRKSDMGLLSIYSIICRKENCSQSVSIPSVVLRTRCKWLSRRGSQQTSHMGSTH